jgi:hypothetical protein
MGTTRLKDYAKRVTTPLPANYQEETVVSGTAMNLFNNSKRKSI